MVILRYVLMAGTTGLLGWFAYVIATGGYRGGGELVVPSLVIGFILNLVYLYFSQPAAAGKQSRLARLVSLWLDAKEHELRDRAKERSNSD
jgi:hypothetical protein